MRILIFGPQGSGKSTQAQLLAKELNLPLISAGDISREIAQESSARGRKVRASLSQGKLTPDEIIAPAVNERLGQKDCQQGFVSDGWPRTLSQAKLTKQEIDLLILINVSEETSIERLTKRGRFDDTSQAIRKRLAIYWQETQPVVDYYKKKGVWILEVNGEPPIEKVQQKILAVVPERGFEPPRTF